MKSTAIQLEELVGQTLWFHGVDNKAFALSLGSRGAGLMAFEALEDDNDGLRSMLDTVTRVPVESLTISRRPFARVSVERDEEYEGYKLVDADDGHVWLRMGTDRIDDFYPMFTFEYAPKSP